MLARALTSFNVCLAVQWWALSFGYWSGLYKPARFSMGKT